MFCKIGDGFDCIVEKRCKSRVFLSLVLMLSLYFCQVLSSSAAMADNGSSGNASNSEDGGEKIAQILCNAVKVLQGNVGKAIAVIVVLTLAISLFLGKITWGTAIAVVAGMGILFGAPTLVKFVSNSEEEICQAPTPTT